MCFIHTDFVGTDELFEVHRFLEPIDEAAASGALVCRPLLGSLPILWSFSSCRYFSLNLFA